MFGIDDAIIAAVAPSVIGGAMDMFGQKQTNDTSRDMMNQSNAFSANQFATRYQTTVKDLEAAGLNPMLAYGQGGGSPPSAVGIAQQSNPYQRAGDIATKAVGAANTAMQTQLTDASVAESISRTGVNDETRKNLDADTKLKILEAPNVSQKTKNMVSEMLLNDARKTATNATEAMNRMQTTILKTGDLPEAVSKGTYHKTTPYNPYMLKDTLSGVNSAANAVGALKGTSALPISTGR
ncbi:MAG: DNA pilot protein [Microvirus sp.]|nr:MAG: DNA pilot protein [Microvirus sp.]